ncbi:membrane protein [Achromobacter sp. RTa]|nr:membrane protein [Achromobacter sp. RTa]
MSNQPYANDALPRESAISAVSWAAVFAGAVIAAALSLALFAGGAGLGFLSVSPWGDEGLSAPAVGIGVIAWMLFTQIVAYGIAGYVAGRLRTKWVDVHADEVYFRDTAHGFLVWAVSAVVSAALMGASIVTLASGVAKTGASAAGGAATAAATATAAAGGSGAMEQASDYFADMLLRTDRPDAAGDRADARAEVGRIVAVSLGRGDMTPEDRDYVASVVAAQAGIEPGAARSRVEQAIQQARKAADEARQKAREAVDSARKAAAAFALWGFASMLIGAFVASLAATWGGRRRDTQRLP